jgi:hypothetical protein
MKTTLRFKFLSTVAAATMFLFSQVIILFAAIVGIVVSAFELELVGIAVCIAIAAVPATAVLILLARMVYRAEAEHVA